MKTIFLFLATGFEEIEAIATIDILRRAGLEVITVSVTGDWEVTGAHDIRVVTNMLFEHVDFSNGDMLILPGGMPGAKNLHEHDDLNKLLLQYHSEGKKLAAICAAPLVLGELNLLQGKRATVYPGFEEHLHGTKIDNQPVVKDGNIITGRGPGLVFDFALAIVEELAGKEKSQEVAAGMLLR